MCFSLYENSRKKWMKINFGIIKCSNLDEGKRSSKKNQFSINIKYNAKACAHTHTHQQHCWTSTLNFMNSTWRRQQQQQQIRRQHTHQTTSTCIFFAVVSPSPHFPTQKNSWLLMATIDSGTYVFNCVISIFIERMIALAHIHTHTHLWFHLVAFTYASLCLCVCVLAFFVETKFLSLRDRMCFLCLFWI